MYNSFTPESYDEAQKAHAKALREKHDPQELLNKIERLRVLRDMQTDRFTRDSYSAEIIDKEQDLRDMLKHS